MSSAGARWASWVVRLTAVVGAFCLLVTAVAVGSPARADGRHGSGPTGGKIIGRITDSARHAVAGARVEVLELQGDPDLDSLLVASATTGRDGRYTVTAVPAGTYRVHIVPPTGSGLATRYQPDGANVLQGADVVVRAGRTVRHIDAALPPEATIAGLVRDGSGAPVPGIRVALEMFQDGIGLWLPAGSATTTAAGTYRVRNLASGTYRVGFTSLATPPEFAAQYYPGVGSPWLAAAVEVGVGQTVSGIDAALAAPAQITGAVTDEQGLVVPGVRVTAYFADASHLTAAETTTTDDGTYVIDGLVPGSYRVSFAPPSTSTDYTMQYYPGVNDPNEATTLAVAAGAHLTGIDAVFLPWDWGTGDPGEQPGDLGGLSGTVTDVGGLPLAGLDVTVFRATDAEGGQGWEYAGYGSTDLDGTYTIGGLADGTYRLGVSDLAWAYVTTYYPAAPDVESATSVEVVDGAVVSGLDVRLASALVPTA